MDEEQKWAYVAGFTDGDGCITREDPQAKPGHYRYSRIRWSQKEVDSYVLDWIGDFLSSQGIKISTRNYSVSLRGHKFPQRELAITNAADSRTALHRLLPYLVVKRERAVEALAIMDPVHELKQKYGNKYLIRMDGCSFPDCDRPYYSKKKCKRHYDGVRRGRYPDVAAPASQ